jgi:hypothetical protein
MTREEANKSIKIVASINYLENLNSEYLLSPDFPKNHIHRIFNGEEFLNEELGDIRTICFTVAKSLISDLIDKKKQELEEM